MANSETKDTSIKLEIKDIVTVITLTVSILVGYFGIVKDIETRLVRLETKFEELDKSLSYDPEPMPSRSYSASRNSSRGYMRDPVVKKEDEEKDENKSPVQNTPMTESTN